VSRTDTETGEPVGGYDASVRICLAFRQRHYIDRSLTRWISEEINKLLDIFVAGDQPWECLKTTAVELQPGLYGKITNEPRYTRYVWPSFALGNARQPNSDANCFMLQIKTGLSYPSPAWHLPICIIQPCRPVLMVL
jgi:hypothetical protein